MRKQGFRSMRIGFCGSGLFASECLKQLSKSLSICWVITNEPQKAGRKMKLTPTVVHNTAEILSIPTKTTMNLSKDDYLIEWIGQNCPDIILVIDFGQMIREPLLSMPRYGCLNIHPSKLPMFRGSSPLQRALFDGLEKTAVTVFKLDEGMDTGPILFRKNIKIDIKDDFFSLLNKAAVLGSVELVKQIQNVPLDDWKFTPQSKDGVSYAPKIKKSEGFLNWNKNAKALYDQIRAYKHFPGTYCFVDGKRLAIKDAIIIDKSGSPGTIIDLEDGFPIVACKHHALRLNVVQQEGGKEQSAIDWYRGRRLQIGDELL